MDQENSGCAGTASATDSPDRIRSEMLTLVELSQPEIDSIAGVVPGGGENIQDIYPLSPIQEGMLFHNLLNVDHDTYVLSTLLEASSESRIDELTSALQQVIQRHDALRTAMLWEGLPRPVQVVCRQVSLPVERVVLDPERDPIEQLEERMGPEKQKWNLRQAPLMRLEVAPDARSGRWYALLRVHHAICDHQSLNMLLTEAMTWLEGRARELPTPEPYKDHVAHALIRARESDAKAFFQERLGGIDEPTAPFGLANVHGSGARLKGASEMLDLRLAHELRVQARCLGVNAARLFHAVWGLVVAHISGRDDIVFGTVILAERHRRGKAGHVLGMAINTLPLRLRLRDVTVKQLVEQTHKELTEVLKYDQAPLALTQRCSGIVGEAPLFSALLNYRRSASVPQSDVRSGAGIRVLSTTAGWTNYPVTLRIDEVGEGFCLTADTDESVSPHRVIGYVQTALQSLVYALEHTPQAPALLLEILPESERRQVIELFNATAGACPQEKLIHELFEEQVERTPGAVAVIYEGRSLTYTELNARANQLAWYLRERRIGPDQLVGICVSRSVEMVVGLLGTLKAGGAYVPLDPSYPAERLQYMLGDAAPRVLLTQGRLREGLPRTDAEVIALDEQWSEIERQPSNNPDATALGLGSRHLAYVIYTSGSTGQPKGVAIEHRNTVNMICWARSAWNREVFSQTLQSTSLNFDLSVYECFVPLSLGGSLRVVENALALVRCPPGITLINTVPSAIKGVLDLGGIPPTTRVVNLAGEALKKDLVEDIFASSQAERVCNLYGPSETTTYSTWVSMTRAGGFVASIGRPIANTQIYILDSRRQPVPMGVAGEIYIGGTGVARGYLNRAELTAERFIQDPFSADTRARMYKTGDLGRWRTDGNIEYLGRNDHQVKIRGFRIELGEIEAQLRRNPQVKESVVLAREDEPGKKRLVAYVVSRESVDPGSALSVETLRAHLKPVLPDHMLPSAFVLLESLPLTSNGKLDRLALPAPELSAYVRQEYEAPQGEIEEILAGIWQALLGVERVGRQDNFFELGGHSLLIVQMLERLRRVGLSAEVRRVFNSPTLADLASVLDRGTTEQFVVPPNLIPPGCEGITRAMLPLVDLETEQLARIVQAVPGGAANIQDIYPLAPLQEGLLFHHLLDAQRGDTYIVSRLLSASSQERLDKLVATLQATIDHHDILRTAVLWEQLPQPVQVVYRRATLTVEEIVLDPDYDPIEQLKERMRPERQKLDLRQAPLLRLQVAADPKSARRYALLQVHHIIGDHQAVAAIGAEVAARFGERARPLESAPYRNYVAQALAYARTLGAEGFFRSKLGDVDEPTAPFGLLDVHGDGSEIEEAHRDLEAAISQRVRAQARRLSVSAATLFHAAWALVVARTSARDDVVYGTVLLGRLQGSAGAQRILGMLINTLPLRLPLQQVTARQLVDRTQRELVELLSHEQSSLALAQRCSAVAGSTPLFSSLLNYRHRALNQEDGWSDASGIQVLAGQDRTNYPITVSVDDQGEGFTITAQADRRIDPERLVQYVCTAVHSLVEALEQAPQTPALSLSILPESERHQVLELFNATKVSYPQRKLIHELFEEQVQRSPQAAAVIYEGDSLTYAQLNAKANQLAQYLRDRQVGPDQLVGICVERSLEMVVGLLGILKAGGAYVPLDPSYPTERLQYMLGDADPRVLLTQAHLQEHLPQMQAEVIALDADWRSISRESTDNLDARQLGLRSSHLSYVIYTSGSTGKPKGVMVEHRNLLNLVYWHRAAFGLSQGACCSCLAGVGFDASSWEIWPSLSVGATLLLASLELTSDPGRLLSWWKDQPLDVSFLPTPIAELVFSQNIRHPSLRTLLAGGDRLRHRSMGQSFRLVNNYGPTESTVVATSGDLRDEDEVLHIGRPISNTQIYILSRHRQPVPVGVAGEIYIGGVGVARGYLNQPELTAERFIKDPFSHDPQGRLYKTGDLGLWRADGTIEYLGRDDHQVKIRGFRIELGEIETQLARHELVREAVVIAREDVSGEKRLVAYVIARDPTGEETGPGAEVLRAHLKAVLPEHMVPSAFVVLEQFPLTPNGKLDRRALPAPDIGAYVSRQYEAPQGEAEEILAGIWQELLHVERVGRYDNFFELGGHSLVGMKLIVKAAEKFAIQIPIHAVFRHPTIGQFSQFVEDRRSNTLRHAAPSDLEVEQGII